MIKRTDKCPHCGKTMEVFDVRNGVVSYLCQNCKKTTYFLEKDIDEEIQDNFNEEMSSGLKILKDEISKVENSYKIKDTPKSNVNHPSHYNQGGIECIEALAAAIKDLKGIEAFCTGNAIKYLWRWKDKNGIEDLEKAKWYINYLEKNIKDTNNK